MNQIEQLEDGLAKWLSKEGYQRYDQDFWFRENTAYKDWFQLSVGIDKEDMCVYTSASRLLKIEIVLWLDIATNLLQFQRYTPSTFVYEPYIQVASTYKDHLLTVYTGRKRVAPYDGVIADLNEFVVNHHDKVLQFTMNELSNIQRLDSLLNNGEAILGVGFPFPFFQRLVVAKLAGNPNYENIFQEMIQAYQKGVKEEPWRADYYMRGLQATKMLYERLRSVEALQNPVLV